MKILKKSVLPLLLILSADVFSSEVKRYDNLLNSTKEYYEQRSLSLFPSKKDPLMSNKSDQAKVHTLWDWVFESEKKEDRKKALETLTSGTFSHLRPGLLMRVVILKEELGLEISKEEKDALLNFGNWKEFDTLVYHTLASRFPVLKPLEDLKLEKKYPDLFELYQNSLQQDQWAEDQVKALTQHEPTWRRSLRGYKNSVRLYMFCRHSREYPCLLVMKDKWGKWVRDSQGKLWSQQKLGYSRHQLPYNQVNGNTPQGVYTIDSVMPEPNRQLVFGKYRRLKIHFIHQSRQEKDLLSLMPQETQALSWWRESVVARDIGRSLFRIHGTGLINTDPASLWYPFVGTSGCVASKENTYDGVTYRDQQELLDKMLEASGLPVQYEQEEFLSGLFYVINLNNDLKPVELSEIEPLL